MHSRVVKTASSSSPGQCRPASSSHRSFQSSQDPRPSCRAQASCPLLAVPPARPSATSPASPSAVGSAPLHHRSSRSPASHPPPPRPAAATSHCIPTALAPRTGAARPPAAARGANAATAHHGAPPHHVVPRKLNNHTGGVEIDVIETDRLVPAQSSAGVFAFEFFCSLHWKIVLHSVGPVYSEGSRSLCFDWTGHLLYSSGPFWEEKKVGIDEIDWVRARDLETGDCLNHAHDQASARISPSGRKLIVYIILAGKKQRECQFGRRPRTRGRRTPSLRREELRRGNRENGHRSRADDVSMGPSALDRKIGAVRCSVRSYRFTRFLRCEPRHLKSASILCCGGDLTPP